MDTLHALVSGMSISAGTGNSQPKQVKVSSEIVQNLANFYRKLLTFDDPFKFHNFVRKEGDDVLDLKYTSTVVNKKILEKAENDYLLSESTLKTVLNNLDLELREEKLNAEDKGKEEAIYVQAELVTEEEGKGEGKPIHFTAEEEEELSKILNKRQHLTEEDEGAAKIPRLDKDNELPRLDKDNDLYKNLSRLLSEEDLTTVLVDNWHSFEESVREDYLNELAKRIGPKTPLTEEELGWYIKRILEDLISTTLLENIRSLGLRRRASAPFFLSPFGLR